MKTVSTRDLKDRLSAYLRRAQRGERILVLRGGRPVAALVPLAEVEGLDEEGRLRQLAAQELIRLPERQAPDDRFSGPRIPARGKEASAMVLEDRR